MCCMIYPLGNLFGFDNWMIILVVALLLFGRRMPEVGRSLGRGIVEFKKGLQGLEDDIESAGKPNPNAGQQPAQPTQYNRLLPGAAPVTPIASVPPANPADQGYKFDPYTGQPIQPAQPQMKFDPYTGKPLTEEVAASTEYPQATKNSY